MMMTRIILSLIFPLGLKMRTDIHAVTKDEIIIEKMDRYLVFAHSLSAIDKLMISRTKSIINVPL